MGQAGGTAHVLTGDLQRLSAHLVGGEIVVVDGLTDIEVLQGICVVAGGVVTLNQAAAGRLQLGVGEVALADGVQLLEDLLAGGIGVLGLLSTRMIPA